MPAWYDIRSLDEADKDREDMEGVDWSVNFVRDLVREEETSHGLNSDRVVVGGFSQVKDTFCQKKPWRHWRHQFKIFIQGRCCESPHCPDLRHASGRVPGPQLLPSRGPELLQVL